jgi:hypothetical protein
MKKLEMTTLVAAAVIALLILAPSVSYAQPGTAANSVVGFPGAGVIQAGDLSDSFLPQAFGPFYSEGGTSRWKVPGTIRFGNFDRAWSPQRPGLRHSTGPFSGATTCPGLHGHPFNPTKRAWPLRRPGTGVR